jgi:hypothetical protein
MPRKLIVQNYEQFREYLVEITQLVKKEREENCNNELSTKARNG